MFFSVCFVLSSLTVWGAFVSGIIVSLCFVVCFVLSSLTVGGAFIHNVMFRVFCFLNESMFYS